MERLTDYHVGESGAYMMCSGNCRGGLCEECDEFEDTGITQEEINRIVDAYGHGLTLRTDVGERLEIVRDIQTERLMELAQAEKDGRLVVLPFKVADIVWTNIAIVGDRYKSADRPYPVEVVFIGFGEGKRFFRVQYRNGRVFPFDFDQVGKTVFMTREEAESALKKREEEDNEVD